MVKWSPSKGNPELAYKSGQIFHVDNAASRQEYEDDEEEYYYYDYEPESSCPPGELKVQVVFFVEMVWLKL